MSFSMALCVFLQKRVLFHLCEVCAFENLHIFIQFIFWSKLLFLISIKFYGCLCLWLCPPFLDILLELVNMLCSNKFEMTFFIFVILNMHSFLSVKSSFQCCMSILGTGDLSPMAFEYKNCEFDAEWKNAYCDNRAGSNELLQGQYTIDG